MKHASIATRMIELQKATADGMMNNIILFWDQAAAIADNYLDKMNWLPEYDKKAAREWAFCNRKGFESIRALIDKGYCNLEKSLSGLSPGH